MMKQEIEKPQKIILMKSKIPIWIDEDRVKSLETILSSGTGHRFVKLDDRVINSAEIEGIYTPAQYHELSKIKQGMWQCGAGKWHQKKEECQCMEEARRKAAREEREKKEAEDNKPMTDEERKKSKIALAKIRKDLEAKGILKPIPKNEPRGGDAKSVGDIINKKRK